MIRGLAVGVHCSDVALTLARCPPRWSVRAYICVCRQPGLRRVLDPNRDWQAFCWALLPHASSNPAVD